MNEEQAVLEFFSKTENLPLGLSVAEQMDTLREQLNNRLWQDLLPRLQTLIKEHQLAWQVKLTEDKNSPDSIVGLHCTSNIVQPIILRPMMEQQYLGGVWRIYFGLMWSATPSPDQLGLPAVISLKESLQNAGFKNNESFLAWQWTSFHPRRKDFLLGFANRPDQILSNMEVILKKLLLDFGHSITQANAALESAPRSMTVSLNQLRNKLTN
jgi:hypothetical protein